jgi:hypothetical protein
MAVTGEKRDKSDDAGGQLRDPALLVESKSHGNQSKP